jgi:hypothetical protein
MWTWPLTPVKYWGYKYVEIQGRALLLWPPRCAQGQLYLIIYKTHIVTWKCHWTHTHTHTHTHTQTHTRARAIYICITYMLWVQWYIQVILFIICYCELSKFVVFLIYNKSETEQKAQYVCWRCFLNTVRFRCSYVPEFRTPARGRVPNILP